MNQLIGNGSPGLLRVFCASLLSSLMLLAPLAPMAVSLKRVPASRARKAESQLTDSLKKQLTPLEELDDPNLLPNPLGPLAPTITATLADDITLAQKKSPGATITYTAIISDSVAD